MTSYRVADAPDALTMVQHLKAETTFQQQCDALAHQSSSALLRLPLPPALFEGLRAAAIEAVETYGLHGWLSAQGRHDGHHYQSLSLVHNPDLDDPGIHDVHQSTLGTSRNAIDQFFYNATGQHRQLKNTYFDTYGFRRRTPAAGTGALGEFLDGCRLTLIRSRLSVMFGEQGPTEDFMDGWHRDEPVFENLRLNIPLTADPAYRIQIEHQLEKPDPASSSMSEHYLEPGYAYTFNTNVAHRVYVREASAEPRLHLVLGFAPWFDHDPGTDSWRANTHFGARHPFSIASEGLLHPQIKA